MLLDAPRPSLDLTASKFPDTPPVDNVIGSMSQTPSKDSSKQKLVTNTGSNNPSKNSSSPDKTSEVHVVQYTTSNKYSKGKKKGKCKAKVDSLNRTLLNLLLMTLLNETRNILASSVRRIITLNIVHVDMKLVTC